MNEKYPERKATSFGVANDIKKKVLEAKVLFVSK